MKQPVSLTEVSERMSQQWVPLGITPLNSWDLEAAKLRQLYQACTILVDISERIRDSVRELEQLLSEER